MFQRKLCFTILSQAALFCPRHQPQGITSRAVAKHMNMQMIHVLTPQPASIDRGAKTIRQTLLRG